MVLRTREIYAEVRGKILLTDARFKDQDQLLEVIRFIVESVGGRIDEETPLRHKASDRCTRAPGTTDLRRQFTRSEPESRAKEPRTVHRRSLITSLRMRPDRIVAGEVRGPEALDVYLPPAFRAGRPSLEAGHVVLASSSMPVISLIRVTLRSKWHRSTRR